MEEVHVVDQHGGPEHVPGPLVENALLLPGVDDRRLLHEAVEPAAKAVLEHLSVSAPAGGHQHSLHPLGVGHREPIYGVLHAHIGEGPGIFCRERAPGADGEQEQLGHRLLHGGEDVPAPRAEADQGHSEAAHAGPFTGCSSPGSGSVSSDQRRDGRMKRFAAERHMLAA